MDGTDSTLAAVVFDWAGTVVDFGSQAPMGAFVELFASEDVAITVAEARVAARWTTPTSTACTNASRP
jgi:phosphonoacetaldehyde hydrolase